MSIVSRWRQIFANQSVLVIFALFFMLSSFYMLTYSANLVVNDELQMLDVTGSRVDFNDTQYDLSLWQLPASNWDLTQEYPLRDTIIDPLQMIVSMPLYWLATQLPNVGIIHMIWLLNIVISALIGVLMYRYALLLGYRHRVALLGAVLLCGATGVWIYSKLYFREPLAMLLLLYGAFWFEHWHRSYQAKQWVRGGLQLGLGAICLGLAMLTKTSLMAVIPAFVVFALPMSKTLQAHPLVRRGVMGLIIGIVLATVLFAYTPILEQIIPDDFDFSVGNFNLDTEYTQTAIHGYFFSIGGSIWGTSPIVILAVFGIWMLGRKSEWRYILLALLSVFGVGMSYALLRGSAWFAGATPPPRFLIPTLPFLMLVILPVIDYLTSLKARRWMQVGLVILVAYSVWWQVVGVVFQNGTYSAQLPPESNQFADWLPSMNRVEYLRPLVLTDYGLSGNATLDSAWIREDVFIAPLLFLLVVIVSGWMLINLKRLRISTVMLAGGVMTIALILGLGGIYRDSRYLGHDETLFELLDVVDAEIGDGDVVILSEPTYHEFLLNYAKMDDVRFVSLPSHPGERGSFEQPLLIESDNPFDLLSLNSPWQIQFLAETQERLWILMDTSLFHPWSIRPVERFMTQHYYPIREITLSPSVRLLEYDTTRATDAEDVVPVQLETDFSFGIADNILLTGMSIPNGDSYQAGDSVAISLFWEMQISIEHDYSVALFLTESSDGQPIIQGWDSVFHGGFVGSSAMQVGEMVVDNRAIRLPDDVPAGEYDIWVRLYRGLDDGTLEILPINGESVLDINGDIAVLPMTIRVE